jgi:hypothetical protein
VELAAWILGGALGGILLGRLLSRLTVPTFTRWYLRRRIERFRPPQGTRPTVLLTYNEVTYDLSDTLIQLPDNPQGMAVWAVIGPQHLRMTAGNTGRVDLIEPMPRNTHIVLRMTGGPDAVRFETADEIRANPGY